eukprot:jgi/Tetstr1/421567/TSEL_012511.t1
MCGGARRKRGRRLVVETSITVQAIVSSCARLGNQKEDEIWWNLDGKWPGSGSASGEVLLNYGVSNCDHRGGIASTDTTPAPAPDGSGRALHKLNSVPRGRGSMPPSRLSSIQSRAHRLSRSFAVTANNRMSTAFGSMLGGPLPFGLPEAVAASQEVPKEGEERGPLGYCKIVLHGLRLAVPQEHICILRCSNYWVRTSPARTREGGSSWRDVVVVLPLWRPSEHIVLAAFSTSGGLRSTVNMIGKLRFRISSLRAGQQLMHGRFPLSSDVGGKPGFAVMSVEWTYTSISSVLQSYFKPTHPDPMFELGIPAMVKDMEKEVNQISIEWLDSCAHPPIPLAVTSKALATSRDNFELKTAQANVRRIMHIIGNIKAIAAAWGRLQRWENQLHSALALIGVVLFVFYPALVVAGVCLGIGVTSMSQSRADANAARAGGEAGEAGEREAGEAAARAADKEDDSPPSIREKYNRLIENALMVQNIMDDIACGAERLQSLTNWHDPTSTLLVCTLLFAAAPLLCLLGLRVVALFGLAWQLRPPRLRDPRTPPPVVFFSHLPTVEAFAEAVDATILAAVERVSFDPSTYGTDSNPVVTDFLAELLHDSDPMAAEAATLSEDAVARARSRLHLPTRLKGSGIRRMATVRDAAFTGCMNAILPRCLTRNSGTNTPTPGFFDPQLGSVLGRGSFNATSSARQYDHFLNDAHRSDSYAAEMREAWDHLQAGTAGHLSDADARQIEREVEAESGSQKEPTAFLDHANNSRLRNEIILPSTEHNPVTVDLYGDALMNLPAPGDAHWRVQHDAIADAFRDHCVHDLGIKVRREVDDLFQQAVPLGNTVPMDELKDLVPDAELSLPAFNVVTGSYDPRSLKSTQLEFKTMRRVLDIMSDMSEYTGMVFGTVGERPAGIHGRHGRSSPLATWEGRTSTDRACSEPAAGVLPSPARPGRDAAPGAVCAEACMLDGRGRVAMSASWRVRYRYTA